MIDLHCHYLPAIDDGSQSMAESLDLARASVADGITHAAMTPHVHVGRYENVRSSILVATNEFQDALRNAGISLKVFPAGEVRLTEDVVELLERDELPFLGSYNGYRILLLEFPYGQIPVGAEKMVRWLLARKIRPLIAHPERYKPVIHSVENIRPFVEMGCFLQLTAASIVGDFGAQAKACAEQLLERRWATLVASDAHNLVHRAPVMARTRVRLAELGGEGWADELTLAMPAKILGIGAAGSVDV